MWTCRVIQLPDTTLTEYKYATYIMHAYLVGQLIANRLPSLGILYMCAQTLGGALAGGILLGVWGPKRATRYVYPACSNLVTLCPQEDT